MPVQSQRQQVMDLFASTTILRTREIVCHGIDAKTIQRMVAEGELVQLSRGVYSIPETDIEIESYHSLAQAQRIVERGVGCLVTALAYHDIGTQLPARICMAVPRGSRIPKTEGHPIEVVSFSGAAYSEGIEEHFVEKVPVRVYSVAKTIADCFKYRNKLGTDVMIEALRDVVRERRAKVDELLRFADICRVRNVMLPYLESML